MSHQYIVFFEHIYLAVPSSNSDMEDRCFVNVDDGDDDDDDEGMLRMQEEAS